MFDEQTEAPVMDAPDETAEVAGLAETATAAEAPAEVSEADAGGGSDDLPRWTQRSSRTSATTRRSSVARATSEASSRRSAPRRGSLPGSIPERANIAKRCPARRADRSAPPPVGEDP